MTLAALTIKNNIVKMILFKTTAIIINNDEIRRKAFLDNNSLFLPLIEVSLRCSAPEETEIN